MRGQSLIALLALCLALAGCGSKFRTYEGPQVTQIHVAKAKRRMYLLHQTEVIAAYDIGLGFTPEGHKQQGGDGRTPEGYYWIDRRNPNSAYHLSLGISYPNAVDVAVARAAGRDPGTNIFIHGRGPKAGPGHDWTAGCIAVTDREMEEIYAMVPDGTPIFITP